MRPDRVEIEDFRGIDRLAIDLGTLTTIIGEHDRGKSSLLRAVARVLDPREPEALPRFADADFHRPGRHEDARATSLSITLGLRADGDDDPPLPGLADGGISLRISAARNQAVEPQSTVQVLDRAGLPLDGVDARALLANIRRRHPAVIVGGPRPSIGRTPPDSARSDRLRSVLRGPGEPQVPLTWDEIVDVREDLLQAGRRLAEQLGPAPDHPRSVRAMTDTPRPLSTDLGAALADDTGRQRRIAALWLLVAILEALPEPGLGEDAEPILLFDDIEANLHPTWLAALCAVALNLPFQLVVTTHSPEVLAWVPLSSLRRLARDGDGIVARAVQPLRYSTDELRRLAFHVRLNRGGSVFARCWVLVEGETEAWLVPEFALIAGIEFPVEGIRVIEFAQCGVTPLLKLADDLGIRWILLADGDTAGQRYAREAREQRHSGSRGEVVVLPAKDIEHYLFANGYAGVIRRASGIKGTRSAGRHILEAMEHVSKPGLALEILAEADARGPDGVPALMRELAEKALGLARG